MDYRFLGYSFLLFVCPGLALFAIHFLAVFLSKKFGWQKFRRMTDMAYQVTVFEHIYYWVLFAVRGLVALVGLVIFLTVGAAFIDGSSYVKHNAEYVQYYEQLEHPKLEDIEKLEKYNKNYKIATMLAKKDVAEKLVLIDETEVLQKMVRDIQNEKD